MDIRSELVLRYILACCPEGADICRAQVMRDRYCDYHVVGGVAMVFSSIRVV